MNEAAHALGDAQGLLGAGEVGEAPAQVPQGPAVRVALVRWRARVVEDPVEALAVAGECGGGPQVQAGVACVFPGVGPVAEVGEQAHVPGGLAGVGQRDHHGRDVAAVDPGEPGVRRADPVVHHPPDRVGVELVSRRMEGGGIGQ